MATLASLASYTIGKGCETYAQPEFALAPRAGHTPSSDRSNRCQTLRRLPVRLPHEAGAYDLLEQIGQGAFGSVYKCRERTTGRILALKILGQVKGEGPRRRFEREGEALARLDHPSIVRVHSATWEGDHPHLALELVEGLDLEQRLDRDGRLEPAEARALLQPLAEAVAHAHARGVLHRDIKPSNVILSEAGRPMLLDFGLASLADSERLTLSGQMIGTPAFMAPEQARGKWDERTDVYGLGALLYAALTGAPPADGDNLAECLVQVMSGPAPDPSRVAPEIPPALAELCRRCLAKEPTQRYASAEELARALAEVDMSPGRSGSRWAAALVAGLGLVGLIAALFLTRPAAEAATAASASPSSTSPSPTSPSPTNAASRSPRASRLPPLTGPEWDELVLSRSVWDGVRDLERLRARTAPEHAGRAEVVAGVMDLAGQIRRGAPWSELRSTFARFYQAPPWPLVERTLPLLRGRILYERGRSAEALQILEKDRNPGAAWTRFEIHVQRGESMEALRLLSGLAKDSSHVGRLARARQARATGDPRTALRLARESVKFSPARLEVARTLFELGETEQGKQELTNFLTNWGPTPEVLALLAEVAIFEKDFPRALQLVERAVGLLEVDRDPNIGYQHARCLMLVERWADAQTLLEALIPQAKPGQPLDPAYIRLAALLGLAYYGLPATRTRAREAWALAHRSNALLAQEALPPETSQAARADFLETGRQVTSGGIDPKAQAKLLQRLLGNSAGGLRPLGELAQPLAAKLAVDPQAPQALQDLQKCRRLAAEGRPWRELRFFLVRALDSEEHQNQVRPAWLRLALARERDLELLEQRLRGGEFSRYGLGEAGAELSLADVSWGLKRTGEAAGRYRAVAARWPETDEGRLAAATAAILRDEFAAAKEPLSQVAGAQFATRAAALRGLVDLAGGDEKAARAEETRAFDLGGAEDARTLALRAAISAGDQGAYALSPEKQLGIGGWSARSLAIRASLASGSPTKIAWALNALGAARDESPEALLLLGYAVLFRRTEVKEARRRVDGAWQAARSKDPQLPFPPSYLRAYAKAYGEDFAPQPR